jgi:hypothetical protein
MTILVNLFGAPSAGKSTARAEVFALLKRQGVNCEEVYEHAKKLTWSKRVSELAVQPYIQGKQLRDIETLEEQVDVTVTDSPLFLSYFYGKKYCQGKYPDSSFTYFLDQFLWTGGINFFIERVKPYNPAGRNQTEAESDEIARELREELDRLAIPYHVVRGDPTGSREIANHVLESLGRPRLPERLFDTRPQALKALGRVYEHYKGGIYRIRYHDEATGIVNYEHLWPHPYEVYERPAKEFFGSVKTDYYTGPRFRRFNDQKLYRVND